MSGIIGTAGNGIGSIAHSIQSTVTDKTTSLVAAIALKIAKLILSGIREDVGDRKEKGFLQSGITKTAANLLIG